MPFTVSVNLDVPDLPDNSVAFLNNAAWVNYWASVGIEAELDSINNTLYVQSAYNNALHSVAFNWEGNDYEVPSIEQFNSLLLQVQALNTNYIALLNALKAAGVLTNSV